MVQSEGFLGLANNLMKLVVPTSVFAARAKSLLGGSGITLANNETKDIVKEIRPLENRGILLKGTTIFVDKSKINEKCTNTIS